jgi:large subunit ribosomal protein L25
MDFIKISVAKREKSGTHLSTRLRREGRVPIVLYGLKKPALSLSVSGKDLERFLRTGNRLVDLALEGGQRTALLRDTQYDAITDELLHVDFLRVDKDQEIEDSVPVVYKGRPKGAAEGGVFQPVRSNLAIVCRPADLPREIVIEVEHLELHKSIHSGQVVLPPGVKLRGSPDLVMCVVTTVKLEVVAAPVEAVAGEPELIGRAKEEEGAEGEGEGDAKGKAEGGKDAKAGDKKPDAKKPEAKKDDKKK